MSKILITPSLGVIKDGIWRKLKLLAQKHSKEYQHNYISFCMNVNCRTNGKRTKENQDILTSQRVWTSSWRHRDCWLRTELILCIYLQTDTRSTENQISNKELPRNIASRCFRTQYRNLSRVSFCEFIKVKTRHHTGKHLVLNMVNQIELVRLRRATQHLVESSKDHFVSGRHKMSDARMPIINSCNMKAAYSFVLYLVA
jgi:hypothetical protein